MAPKVQQLRIIELVSNAPPALLWLAEKGANHERVLVAEYGPKGGGKGFLRDFGLWFKRLRELPAGLLPALSFRYSDEERLFLVFGAPGGLPVRKIIQSGHTPITGTEFLQRLLTLTEQFAQGTASLHGWIRAETVTVSEGKLLLGPPAFAPGEVADPQSDLKECARLSAQWEGIPLRPSDADAEQCNQLRKVEDWPLAATIEWILFCKDRAPQSAGQAMDFLGDALAVPKGDSEKDLSAALDALKKLYQPSGSTIVKLKIDQTEERLSRIAKASESPPAEKAAPARAPAPGPELEDDLAFAARQGAPSDSLEALQDESSFLLDAIAEFLRAPQNGGYLIVRRFAGVIEGATTVNNELFGLSPSQLEQSCCLKRLEALRAQACLAAIDLADRDIDTERRNSGLQQALGNMLQTLGMTLIDPLPNDKLQAAEHQVVQILRRIPGVQPGPIAMVRGLQRGGEVIRKASVLLYE
jgi:hypothetical protein